MVAEITTNGVKSRSWRHRLLLNWTRYKLATNKKPVSFVAINIVHTPKTKRSSKTPFLNIGCEIINTNIEARNIQKISINPDTQPNGIAKAGLNANIV